MNDLEERARADLADLNRFLTKARDLAEQLIGEIRYSQDDHLNFMILSFLCKLTEQARSVQILVSDGLGRDAELVGRSMVECMVLLLWAAQNPSERAFRWRGFSYVEDFRLMMDQKSKGLNVDEDIQRQTDDFLEKNASVFEHPKRAGRPDPFYKDWRCGVTIKQVFDAVRGELLYVQLYRPFSDWIHSGVKSIGKAISSCGKTARWLPPPPSVDASALAVAFQSLAEVLKLSAEHFGTILEGQLDGLTDHFYARFKPAVSADR